MSVEGQVYGIRPENVSEHLLQLISYKRPPQLTGVPVLVDSFLNKGDTSNTCFDVIRSVQT